MDFAKAITEIQDTLVVMANIEARMSRALADQARWMENHEMRLQEHEARMTTIDVKLAEISDKLNALINFVQRQHAFPEVQ